ncbi:ADP-ribosylation factor-like protein 2-binding protein [Halyomorpha halys]|uniref:ADP-ribosylation factor-like protein 2-binding protein n=1 Tax=Halyomorpha halys TaxID=286706 RepID=UPI0006D4F981|nr:ADP-ribosylation factor-like protein 2-binding protein [Halyomorpha halys]
MKRYASFQNTKETITKDELSPDENASPLSTFDVIIGHIEDILIDEEFLELQKCILEKHCEEFDETEENKLCYTSVFEEYVSIMESYIEQRLKKEIIGFDLEEFYEELHKRRDSLDGEVFEVLYTLSDFIAFKEMILCYKNAKDGKTADFSQCICVKAISLQDS